MSPVVFRQLVSVFGVLDFVLFATSLNHHLLRFYSSVRDPGAFARDAFAFPWGVKGLCLSPVRVDSLCAQKDQGRSSVDDPYSPVVAGEVVVPGPLGPSGGDSVFASLSSRFGVTTSVRFSTSESGNPPSDCLVGIGERAHSSGFL